jgi:hypothetical protein
MKNKNLTFICIIALNLLSLNSIYSQAFHKGALLISISEGVTKANYSTNTQNSTPPRSCDKTMYGESSLLSLVFATISVSVSAREMIFLRLIQMNFMVLKQQITFLLRL